MNTINSFAQAMLDDEFAHSLKEEAGTLNVLLVEDEKSQAMLIGAMLNQYGHTVHTASSGEQAIEMFRQVKPDLVLMDVIMPGIDGYEATKAIRAEHKEWVPIIFLTGRTEKTERLYALKVGGDDFFSKPVDPIMLIAKMNVMSRIHRMQKQLKQFLAVHEEEEELAAYVMERYLNSSQHDSRVESSILAASHHFSGDAITVAKTPDGGLNVMMVDAMGHGLPAAINVLPAIQAFYAMSQKGISLQDMIIEINDRVRALTPSGRFLAAVFLHLNPTNTEISGWVGGTPNVYLHNQGETKTFISSNMSLGILPSSRSEFEFFSAPWTDKSILLTCTDGVIESCGENGSELGEEWICEVIKKHGSTLNKAVFDQEWKQGLAGNQPHDDASVLIINQSLV